MVIFLLAEMLSVVPTLEQPVAMQSVCGMVGGGGGGELKYELLSVELENMKGKFGNYLQNSGLIDIANVSILY